MQAEERKWTKEADDALIARRWRGWKGLRCSDGRRNWNRRKRCGKEDGEGGGFENLFVQTMGKQLGDF